LARALRLSDQQREHLFISVDCDVLIVAGDDLRIMVYTVEPGSADAERLALAVVLGTQHLVG
jgi:hypothetical protein